MSLPAFLAARVSTGCLPWSGAQTTKGYGTVRHDGKTHYVHILAWEEEHGPIPDPLTVEHKCRVRCCMNVSHMELVTRAENSRRGNAVRWAAA